MVTLIRLAKIEHDNKVFSGLHSESSSSKNWWRYLREASGQKKEPQMPPLVVNNKIITDSKEKADTFNNYFASQATLDRSKIWHPGEPPACNTTITDLHVTEQLLSTLDTSKATGPDGIGNRLLKEAAPSISHILAKLFNISLNRESYPDTWKLAHVIPLCKKDDRSSPSNYRPVSLLPCISKVLEKVVFNHVHQYLQANNLLTSKQSGFTPGDSTVNQLIHVCHKLYSAFDDSDEVQAVFLDFSKAFDSVWHEGLIYKLGKMGIKGKLLLWFKSYLSDRKQKVVINGETSDIKAMECGVPQGSVLGPLLFLVYINDIVDNIKSDIYLFADDASLFETVRQDIHRATAVINEDLNTIHNWCTKWLIRINVSKTKCMLFSRKR